MSIVVGEIVAPVTVNTEDFRRGIRTVQNEGNQFTRSFGERINGLGNTMQTVAPKIGGAFKSIGGNIESIGNSIKGVGETLTKSLTLPIAAASVAVFKLGKDFESELSKVVGLVGVAKDQVDEWGADILELAPELGKSPRELAQALFFVTSAGLRGAEALDVLEASGKASAAGLGETATIADLVTSAMNAYGSENLSASKATDILVSAVREGKAEASALAGSMGQVLPLAAEMGVSFDQVAAAQAAMTRTGTGADEAATQLKSIMSGLLKPSKQAEDALLAMGTSSAKLRKQIKEEGLISTLADLRELTNKYGEDAIAKVYPNIRGLMGVLDLMGSSAETNVEIFDRVRNSTGTLDEAFKAASETLDFKWNQSLAQIQATAIGFFDYIKAAMIPVLETLNKVLSFVGEKFAGLSEPIKKAILIFTAILATIGPVVTVIGTLIAGLGITIAGLGGAITAIGAAITTIGLPALGAIALSIPILIGWVTALVAVIGAWIASFVYLWKTNEDFRKNVIKTWSIIKENGAAIFNELKVIISIVVEGIRKLWSKHGDQITSTLKTAWDFILNIVRIASEQLKNIVKLISSVMKGDWSAAWASMKNIISTGVNSIKIILSGFKNVALGVLNSLSSLAASIMVSMVKRMQSALSALSGVGKQAVNWLLNSFKGNVFYVAGKNIIQSLINGIKSMISSVSSTMTSVVSTIRNKLPFSPAKEGPLRDLNKINFAGSINESLRKARGKIQRPSIELGQTIMDNLLNEKNINLSSGMNNENININSLYIHGVEDLYSLMQKIKEITRRYVGR